MTAENSHFKTPMFLKTSKAGWLLLVIFLVYLPPANCASHAQSSDQQVRIGYNGSLLSISATDADLKNVLLKLADKTDIYVWFPDSLKKKITIRINKLSLREALQRLLKGFNHAIIYSGASKNQAAIAKVFVLKKSKQSRRASGRQRQITNRIRAYEKRIERLRRRLTQIDVNSRRGKSYVKQIRRLENRIARLQRR